MTHSKLSCSSSAKRFEGGGCGTTCTTQWHPPIRHNAVIAKAMLARGDRQHDIAAWLGVNVGRIGEIASDKSHRTVQPDTGANLPPPGPYPNGRDATVALQALVAAKAAIHSAEEIVRQTANLRLGRHPIARALPLARPLTTAFPAEAHEDRTQEPTLRSKHLLQFPHAVRSHPANYRDAIEPLD